MFCFGGTARTNSNNFCPPEAHEPPRWMSALEQAAAMGFPITDLQVAAANGTVCCFTLDRPAPAHRTRRSCAQQVGNSMHVASIGSVILFNLLQTTAWGLCRLPPFH